MAWKIVRVNFLEEDREVYGVLDTSDGFFMPYKEAGRNGIPAPDDLDELLKTLGIPEGAGLRKWGKKKEGLDGS